MNVLRNNPKSFQADVQSAPAQKIKKKIYLPNIYPKYSLKGPEEQ